MNHQAGDTIFTIGHSTRTLAEFVNLLRQVDVTLLVDVRSIPRSRATPQFKGTLCPMHSLATALATSIRLHSVGAATDAGRATLSQHILARPGVPKLRRLRGDRRIPRGIRRPARFRPQ